MGAAQTAPIIVSNEPAFTIVDTSGNTLHFDRFAYERSVEAARGEYFNANWVRCRITLQARVEPFNGNASFKQSVNAQLLTTEIKELLGSLNAVLSSAPGTERTFEPMEPYIELKIERSEKSVDITARLDLAPAIGPVIEFFYVCRPEEIEATIAAIAHVQEAFPERKL
jgi:hypothetical protein